MNDAKSTDWSPGFNGAEGMIETVLPEMWYNLFQH
jgi:hypothetical protein